LKICISHILNIKGNNIPKFKKQMHLMFIMKIWNPAWKLASVDAVCLSKSPLWACCQLVSSLFSSPIPVSIVCITFFGGIFFILFLAFRRDKSTADQGEETHLCRFALCTQILPFSTVECGYYTYISGLLTSLSFCLLFLLLSTTGQKLAVLMCF